MKLILLGTAIFLLLTGVCVAADDWQPLNAPEKPQNTDDPKPGPGRKQTGSGLPDYGSGNSFSDNEPSPIGLGGDTRDLSGRYKPPPPPAILTPPPAPPHQAGHQPGGLKGRFKGATLGVIAPEDKMKVRTPWRSYFMKLMGLPTENQKLKGYLGTVVGLDHIIEVCRPEEMLEKMGRYAQGRVRLGKPSVSLLFLVGHGSAKGPQILLCGSNLLGPADMDFELIQRNLDQFWRVYQTHADTYCRLKGMTKRTAEEDQKLDEAKNSLYGLSGELAGLRDKLKRLVDLKDLMAPNGVVQLLNCSGAATAKHVRFLTQLGRVLMWQNGGQVWASTTDINVAMVEPGDTTREKTRQKYHELLARLQTGQKIKPGDYFLVGNWKQYLIPKEKKCPIDTKWLTKLKDIEDNPYPRCQAKPALPAGKKGLTCDCVGSIIYDTLFSKGIKFTFQMAGPDLTEVKQSTRSCDTWSVFESRGPLGRTYQLSVIPHNLNGVRYETVTGKKYKTTVYRTARIKGYEFKINSRRVIKSKTGRIDLTPTKADIGRGGVTGLFAAVTVQVWVDLEVKIRVISKWAKNPKQRDRTVIEQQKSNFAKIMLKNRLIE